MGAAKGIARGGLNAVRRLKVLRWTLATRARMAWAGVELDLDIGPGVVLYALPKVRIATQGRGGSLRIRFGREVRIREGFDLEVTPGVDSVLDLGDNVNVYATVAFKMRGGSIKVGEFTQIRENVVIKATGDVEMGRENTISYNVVIHCTESIKLGDHVGLGERTSVVDSGHDVDGSDEPWTAQPVGTAPIEIGRNTMVFSNVVIMRGTTLGKNTIVAASSVVTGGEFDDNAVLLGAPARQKSIHGTAQAAAAPDPVGDK